MSAADTAAGTLSADQAKYSQIQKDFFEYGGYDLFRDLEDKYDCAGVCYKPLFYLSKPIIQGRVERECVEVALEEINNQPLVGYISLGTAALILLALIGSCSLCSGLKENEVQPGEEGDADKEEKGVQGTNGDIEVADPGILPPDDQATRGKGKDKAVAKRKKTKK